jgi:hypothetical protein
MKQTKKAIRQLIEDALHQVSITLDLTDLSKRTRKAIQQTAKELSDPLREELKKKQKRETQLSASSKKVPGKNA